MTKIDRFIKRVAELEREFGYVIDGCGCCGSPYIQDCKTGKVVMEDTDPEWGRRHDNDELRNVPR